MHLEQLELPLKWPEVSVDGIIDEARNVRYIGTATMRADGKWTCLADINGALFLVQVPLRFVA